MPQDLIQVTVRGRVVKVVLILLIALATTWSYFVVRWYMGNTIAEYFNTAGDNLDLARIATDLAPADPLPRWRLGQVSQKKLPLDQQAAAIAEYEKAVGLSPYDYRFWMALGTAQEQTGNNDKGELALRRAVSLAPAYAYPHWYLGNLLLRDGRYDEAFAELRTASDGDPTLRPQMFNLIWQLYGDDIESALKVVGPNSSLRAEFAVFLITQDRLDHGLTIWNGFSAADKTANRNSGDAIVRALIAKSRYHEAVSVWNTIAPNDNYRTEVGQVFDGGFEKDVAYGPEKVFGWQVQGTSYLQVGIDPGKAYSGKRSLRFVFQVRTRLENINASLLVPVLSDKEYDFECYVRTEKLESGSTPLVLIVDTTDSSVLATSDQAPTGDADWTKIPLSFKTGAKTQAVTIRIIRGQCGEDSSICPIFGAIWYDDFSFKPRG